MEAGMCGPQRSHLAKAGNIEGLSSREDVVDATTDGIVRGIVEVNLVVRLESWRLFSVSCSCSMRSAPRSTAFGAGSR